MAEMTRRLAGTEWREERAGRGEEGKKEVMGGACGDSAGSALVENWRTGGCVRFAAAGPCSTRPPRHGGVSSLFRLPRRA